MTDVLASAWILAAWIVLLIAFGLLFTHRDGRSGATGWVLLGLGLIAAALIRLP